MSTCKCAQDRLVVLAHEYRQSKPASSHKCSYWYSPHFAFVFRIRRFLRETKRELEILLLKSRTKPKPLLKDKLSSTGSGTSPFKPQYVEEKKKRLGPSSKGPAPRGTGFKPGYGRLWFLSWKFSLNSGRTDITTILLISLRWEWSVVIVVGGGWWWSDHLRC